MSQTIHIYHTNDLHSHFESWAIIHEYLREMKKWHEEKGEVCLILDIGDHVDRSHPFTEGSAGKGNTELLNKAEYDAVTIGNNEGITLSKEELNELYVQADFHVIVANLFDENGLCPHWAKPYHITTTSEGVKIGLIGATAEFAPFYNKLGWTVTDAKKAIAQTIETIKGKVDLIICMSHLGIKEDELLAVTCPEIDVILGAHTHHMFTEGLIIGDTLLGAAGKFGLYIGHIVIEESLKIKKASLIETAKLKNPDEGFNEKLIEIGKIHLERSVFYNNEPLKVEWFKESKMSDLFGEAILEFSGADCALFNAGIFMKDLLIGETTFYDFHQILPHPITPCLIELTGAELKEIYIQSMNIDWPIMEFNGLGFRGNVFGNIIRINMNMEGHNLYVNGKLIVQNKIYSLVTLDMFTFGYFFPTLKSAPKNYFGPKFIRDVFSEYFINKPALCRDAYPS